MSRKASQRKYEIHRSSIKQFCPQNIAEQQQNKFLADIYVDEGIQVVRMLNPADGMDDIRDFIVLLEIMDDKNWNLEPITVFLLMSVLVTNISKRMISI